LSLPYDPDFQEEAPPPVKKTVPAAEPPEAAQPLPDWVLGAGPFLLLDREDPSRIFTAAPSSAASRDFGKFLLELKPLEFDTARWERMRANKEAGIRVEEEIPILPPIPAVVPIAEAEVAPPPQPAPPELIAPGYETSLSITGRKLIGFTFSEKRYLREQTTSGRGGSTNLLDITQQLQLRMQGKVGPKITVNVDYDDTKTNKQDISVVYQGDPNEVVQNASFGDIDLSLPATEFVSYNKQLFGIRVEVKMKRFRAIFIGSRTKGTTKTKQFKGNTQFVTRDVPDISYLRQQYYDLTFGDTARLPILPGSERVYLSRQSIFQQQQNVNDLTLETDDLAVPSSTFTGRFVQLAAGVDYTVDYIKGILTFRRMLSDSDVVAVDFVDATGNQLSVEKSSLTAYGTGRPTGNGWPKLMKTFADVPIALSTETGHNRELKTFYGIGQTSIVRDDGRGSFFLRVLDKNRNNVGAALNPTQVYPDNIDVDFENGIFQLREPFAVVGDSATADAEIYARQSAIHKYLFQLEYRFRLKTFFLEPNLVLQSEIVILDGVRLTRNADYFIDYESGFLTFFNEGRIRTDSQIDVTFEVAPFAGVATESLLGTRVSCDLIENRWSVGSTLLYQSGSKPPTIPSVGELAKSLLVYEFDTQLKDIRLLPRLTGSFAGEIAQSRANPNLSKRALIDNMEGVKQEDSAGLLSTLWLPASNPTGKSAAPAALTRTTIDERIKNINPSAPTTEQDSQKVLQLDYDFTLTGSTTKEVSVVYPFSPTGVDFTQKTLLEVTLYQGAASDNEINFRLGGINEDSDGDGIYDTEDVNLDGILNLGEDGGYSYNPSAGGLESVGASNGRIDSEDLNRDGTLDPDDGQGGNYGYLCNPTCGVLGGAGHGDLYDATSGSTRTVLDFTDDGRYHVFQIPLNITTATVNNFQAVKQLRISLRQGNGGSASGMLRIARIAVVGNSWQRGQGGDPAVAGSTATGGLDVSAVNNVDNPGYLPIFSSPGEANDVFNELYGSVDEMKKEGRTDTLTEQSLQLSYRNLTANTTVYTRRVYTKALDISQHREFTFLLYGNAQSTGTAGTDTTGNKVFFLRAGADQSFFEVQVPIKFQGWKKITARQVDVGGDQIPDRWEVGQAPAGTVVLSTGNPSLQNIGVITAGIYSKADHAATGNTGAVWLNEIYLAQPITRTGMAAKLQMDFAVPGWATFGMKYRFVDRNYETPTTLVANQDNRQDSGYLNFSRLSFFPMSFSLSRSVVTTPNTQATGDRSNLVGLLSQGKVTTYAGNAVGTFQLGALPRLSLSYDRQRTERQLLTRLDDAQTYNSALTYTVPGKRPWLPQSLDLTYRRSMVKVSFDDPLVRRQEGYHNSDELTTGYGARLAFTPWRDSSFSPNYSLTTVTEKRVTLLAEDREEHLRYPKSKNQSVGFTSAWRILSWLRPSVGYSVSTIENNLLNRATHTVGNLSYVYGIGDLKTINRSATGNIGLTLNIAEIWSRTKLFRSMSLTNGYQLQDGDTYEKVERGFDSTTALWIRTPLRTSGPVVQRTNLTLRDTFNSTQRWSPLEAYDIKGRKAAFKTFSMSNNLVRSIQRNDKTGTRSKTISTTLPDLIATLGQLEKLLFAEKWMRNGQINMRYAAHNTLNVGLNRDSDDSLGSDLRAMIRGRFDTSLSFNLRRTKAKDLLVGKVTQTTEHKDATAQTTFDMRKVRLTPKVDYQTDVTRLGTGAETTNITVITPSLLMRADVSMPRGLQLPFARKALAFTNRFIWTTTLAFTMRSSPVTLADNSRLFNLNTSADYEISKNLRMTLNGAASRLWHKYTKEEEYVSYQFGTLMTFQF